MIIAGMLSADARDLEVQRYLRQIEQRALPTTLHPIESRHAIAVALWQAARKLRQAFYLTIGLVCRGVRRATYGKGWCCRATVLRTESTAELFSPPSVAMYRVLNILTALASAAMLVESHTDAQSAPVVARQWEVAFSYGRATGGPSDRVLQAMRKIGYGDTPLCIFDCHSDGGPQENAAYSMNGAVRYMPRRDGAWHWTPVSTRRTS